MPNISLRKKRNAPTWKPRKTHKRRKRQQGLSHKDQRSLASDAVDELDNICDMLFAAPMFASLSLMVRQIQEGMPAEKRDEIARFAKKHFDYDVDQLTEQPYQLEVIHDLPEALTMAAHWRLQRLQRLLSWGLRTKPDKVTW